MVYFGEVDSMIEYEDGNYVYHDKNPIEYALSGGHPTIGIYLKDTLEENGLVDNMGGEYDLEGGLEVADEAKIAEFRIATNTTT